MVSYDGQEVCKLGLYLSLIAAGMKKLISCKCGKTLCSAGENWKQGALEIVVEPSAAEPWARLIQTWK